MARRAYDTVMVHPYLTGAAGNSDGLALVDSARSMQPAASLIVMTAYATPAISDSFSRGRIHRLLVKPRPVTELGRAALADTTVFSPSSPASVKGSAE
jgi:ActR/RegA family two-component response regulator